jgi:hypothetical protein
MPIRTRPSWAHGWARPFGRAHLDRLADALASARQTPQRVSFAWWLALVRNVAMYPVVVLHAVRVVLSR